MPTGEIIQKKIHMRMARETVQRCLRELNTIVGYCENEGGLCIENGSRRVDIHVDSKPGFVIEQQDSSTSFVAKPAARVGLMGFRSYIEWVLDR